MKKEFLKNLCISAMLAALQIVLARFCSFQAVGLRFSFGFVPVVIAAMMLGPLWAGSIGAVADVIGTMIFPSGPYHPGFTAVAFLIGIVYGLFLKKGTLKSVKFWVLAVLSVVISNLGLGLFVNSFWLSQLYTSKTYMGWVVYRLSEYAVMVPLQIIFIPFIKKLTELIKKSRLHS